MDYQRFINQLPNLYENWGQASIRPKSNQFQKIREQIAGFTTANILQLLNFAVDCLDDDEVYCQIGCSEGASLIGALLNQTHKEAFAVDNLSNTESLDQKLATLTNNLVRFNLENQVMFFNQDFLEFFIELKDVIPTLKIGVLFFNTYQDYRRQLLGLLLAEPFLADQALIITHNSNWSPVQQANCDFISTSSHSQLLLDLPTHYNCHHTFGNGLQLLSFNKTQELNNNLKSKFFSNTSIINACHFGLEFQQPNPLFLPANYLQIDNFLPTKECQEILNIAWQNKPNFIPSEIGEGLHEFDNRQSLFITSEFFPQGAELIIKKIMQTLPEVTYKLNKPLFPASKFEAQLTVHTDGDYYKIHTDNDALGLGDCTREITYVYYFYQEPKSFQGGELRLYDTQISNQNFAINGNFIDIQPRNNSIVFFDSRCLHEVLPVRCSSNAFEDGRFTVNGWIHL
jgi:Rps23 Pro-64 3,4-dihydroxylase Tpa1-like proline 4-hydroxylase